MNQITYSIKGATDKINPDLDSYEIKPDLNYLIQILNIRRHSKSKTQSDFADSIAKFYEYEGASVERDPYGNVYVTKGNSNLYPCMVAHLDINQTQRDNVTIHTSGDIMFGFDSDEGVQAGMGADDGCGVALAYEMFIRFDNIKLFFPLDEEIGCKGSNVCDPTFFTDCSMILQGDRRSYSTDLITYTNGIETCSKEFVTAASSIMSTYGYKDTRGVCTDIGSIKKNSIVDCIACNVSIGYFNEHSDEEVISIKAYYNAVNFVYKVIEKLGNQKWHHVHTPKQIDLFTSFPNVPSVPKADKVNDYGWSGSSTYYTGFEDSPFDNLEENYQYLPKGIDKEYNEYILDSYPSMKDTANREQLESYDADGESMKDFCEQEEIDSLLMQSMCPFCLRKIEVTNELLLNLSCDSCNSVFNSTYNLENEESSSNLF
jgi:hypothetical protein